MSPVELRYFLEVTNTLNLSRASERLGISQPSLSIAIKRLEQSIGIELLIRHKRGVTLTQAGKQLLAHAKQLIQFWDEIKSKSLASCQSVQGKIILGCHAAVGLQYLPHFMPLLLQKYPKLEIQLKHDISRKITENVVNLSIDIGIVVNPYKHPDLIIKKLKDDEVTLWYTKENYLTQNIKSESAVIICNPELMQCQALLMKCKKQGISFNRLLSTDNFEIIAKLTAQGAGIGILPTSIAIENFPKKLKQIRHAPTYKDEICIIYRYENKNVKAIQTIIQAILALSLGTSQNT